tara:strand:+ start:1682 stop:2269 length:588 start_codon:yes stop_codon:yes gene_type:complete
MAEQETLILPIWNVFVLFLIIASNYIGELFPCRVQDLLMNNVYLKHFISFLTLLFFVVLTDTSLKKKKFYDIFISSIKLYLIFLLLINCNKKFFVIALVLLGLIYIIQLMKNDYLNNEDISSEDETKFERIKLIEKIIYNLFFIVLVLGFIVYMGEKKIEYKNSFNYKTFIFGKPSCRGKSPETKLVNSFISAFK